MARGGGLNVLGALISQASVFAITTVIAKGTGRTAVGQYAECYSLLTLLGLLSLAGFRAALTRFIAMHLADQDHARIRGTVRFGLRVTVVGSVVVSLALAAVSSQLAGAFHDPGLRSAILVVALTLPASTFEDAALSATQGWRSQRSYTLIGLILDPSLRLILTCGLILLGSGVMGAIWALAAAAWVGAVLSGLALRSRLRSVPKAAPMCNRREILDFSIISWGSTLATTGLVWADTLLLGVLTTQQAVGIYTVSTRLVTLAVFVLAPINAAFVPHMAHLYHIGDRLGMSRVYGAANRWIIRLSMPAFILLVVFPHDLLGFFGAHFGAGAKVTVILAVGQLVNAAAGPCGSVLNMTGRVRLSLLDNVTVLLLNVGLNLLLIPSHGIVGAAIAWSVSLCLVNAAKVLQIRHYVGIKGNSSDSRTTLLASFAAFAVVFALGQVLRGWFEAVSIGGSAVLLVFLASLAVLGIGADDSAVVRQALGRFGLR